MLLPSITDPTSTKAAATPLTLPPISPVPATSAPKPVSSPSQNTPTPQAQPQANSLTLDDSSRSRLDGIVQQMQQNKESDQNIQAVVDDFKSKYGTPPTPAQKINSDYEQNKVPGNPLAITHGGNAAADAVIQDVGEAARQTNDALMRWSPLGWVTKGIGAATDLVAAGAKAIVDPIATAAGGALRNVVGADKADAVGKKITDIANSDFGKKAAEEFGPAFKDVGAVGEVANLGATVTGTKAGLEGLSDFPKALDPKSPIPKAVNALGEAAPDFIKDKISETKESLKNHYVSQEKSSWKEPATIPKATYGKATEIFSNAAEKGNDIPETLVKNGIKLSDNVENGSYTTSDSAEKIRADAGKMSSELLRPSLQMADYSTPKTPVADIIKSTIQDIKNSKSVTPGDIETQLEKAKAEGAALERKYPDGMSLTDMHDTKIDYASNGRYSPVGDTNVNNIAGVNRAFGRSLAALVEGKTPEGIPVKEFNAELQKQYQAADYLDALNNKKVPQSIISRIAKTSAKVVGAAVGERLGGGILSTVGGYHLGGMLEQLLENMSDPVRGHFLNTLEMTNPKAFEAIEEFIGKEKVAQLQRPRLPAPSPLGSEKNPIIGRAPTSFEPQAPIINYNTPPQLALPPGGTPTVYPSPIALPANNPPPQNPLNPTKFTLPPGK